MNPFEVLKLNVRIVRTMNNQDRDKFGELLDEVVTVPGIFHKKRYIWNVIRPQDFYVSSAYWVIGKCKTLLQMEDPDERAELMRTIETTVHEIMETTNEFKVRRNFIWRITKHTALVTIDTLPYISQERLHNIITGKAVITDDAVEPLLREIRELNKQLDSMQETINVYQAMAD